MSRLPLLMALVGVVSLLVVDAVRYEADLVDYVAHEKALTRGIERNQFNRPDARLLKAGVTS